MLTIVATPIGNLEDVSIRQAKTLMEADIILAEDTRSASTLREFMHAKFEFERNPHQQMWSYYKDNEYAKLPEVLELLKGGKNVALISESGMPLISDPGFLLLSQVVKENIPYTVVPGASSVITALALSGFNPANFMFLGFLPKKNSQLVQSFKRLNTIHEIIPDVVFVFFESPHRIKDTLQILADIVPDSQIALCRELTKKFEEVVRGKPSDLLDRDYKGEITLVLKL